MARRKIRKIDYREMFAQTAAEDHRIGEDILLLDEFYLDSVHEYEFTSAGNTFLEILEGEGSITVSGTRYPIKGHCLIVYFQGQIVKAEISSMNAVQRGAVFSDKFMEELYHSSIKFSDIRTSLMENPVIQIDEPTAKRLELYVRTLREIVKDSDNENCVACARFETLSLFYGPLQNCFRKKTPSRSIRKSLVSTDFFSLLKVNFKTEKQLKFYAGSLNITDRYLFASVLSTTGKSPSYWIDYYLMLEAKRLLIENDLSISQISKVLGFAGPSQFGKFFKRHEKKSAGQFRMDYSK